jgi:hypothetical protein
LGAYAGEPDGWLKGGAVARSRAINRTQGLVLGFFVLAWTVLVVMVAVSPAVRDVVIGRMPGSGAPVVVGFLVALLGFLTVMAIGVLRRWRWAFWLILVAFGAGLLRVPVAVLQLSGRMAPEGAGLVRRRAGRHRSDPGRDRGGDVRRLSPLRTLGCFLKADPRRTSPVLLAHAASRGRAAVPYIRSCRRSSRPVRSSRSWFPAGGTRTRGGLLRQWPAAVAPTFGHDTRVNWHSERLICRASAASDRSGSR